MKKLKSLDPHWDFIHFSLFMKVLIYWDLFPAKNHIRGFSRIPIPSQENPSLSPKIPIPRASLIKSCGEIQGDLGLTNFRIFILLFYKKKCFYSIVKHTLFRFSPDNFVSLFFWQFFKNQNPKSASI